MTPRQVSLIRQSFSQLAPREAEVARLFYDKLFALDPSLRDMFKGDMAEQGEKLMKVMGVVVAHADRLDAVIPTVRGLGKRHVGYGVREEHFATVGKALIATLEEGLGPAFDAELREAWTQVYVTVSTVMIDAGKMHQHAMQMENQMRARTAAAVDAVTLAPQVMDQRNTGRIVLWTMVAAVLVVFLLTRYLSQVR